MMGPVHHGYAARRRILTAAVVVATVALSACGDGDSEGATTTDGVDDSAQSTSDSGATTSAAPTSAPTTGAPETTVTAPTTADSDETSTSAGGDVPAVPDVAIEDIAQCFSPDAEVPGPGDTIVVTGPVTRQVAFDEVIMPAFKEDTGLDAVYIGSTSDAIAAKVSAGAGGQEFDVINVSPAYVETLRIADLLEELDYSKVPEITPYPENLRDILPTQSNAVRVMEYPQVLAYNTELLAEMGLPEPDGIDDMFDPIYDDVKIGFYQPPFGTNFALIAVVNHMLGNPPGEVEEAIAELATLKDKYVPIPNNSVTDTMIAEGEFGMHFESANVIVMAVENGLPLKMAFGDPVFQTGAYSAIPKGAQNPGGACIFLNWSLSERGQEAHQAIGGFLSAHPNVVENMGPLFEDLDPNAGIVPMDPLIVQQPPAAEITEMWNRAFG